MLVVIHSFAPLAQPLGFCGLFKSATLLKAFDGMRNLLQIVVGRELLSRTVPGNQINPGRGLGIGDEALTTAREGMPTLGTCRSRRIPNHAKRTPLPQFSEKSVTGFGNAGFFDVINGSRVGVAVLINVPPLLLVKCRVNLGAVLVVKARLRFRVLDSVVVA